MGTSLCRCSAGAFVALVCSALAFAQQSDSPQQGWLKHGNFVASGDLPGQFEAALHKAGGRLMSADKATVSLAGTLTDGNGSRPAQITVQAPGYLRFQEPATSRVLTFDGSQFRTKNSQGPQDDERIEESLLAHLPDMLFLQLATGGGLRRLGANFRTDDGRTPNYSGPYWTVYAFSPAPRKGMVWGRALQQSHLIAIDQKTLLISEVRVVDISAIPRVIQTKFNRWYERAGQWYPGEIVRLEDGHQVLKFTVEQAGVGAQLPVSTIVEP